MKGTTTAMSMPSELGSHYINMLYTKDMYIVTYVYVIMHMYMY